MGSEDFFGGSHGFQRKQRGNKLFLTELKQETKLQVECQLGVIIRILRSLMWGSSKFFFDISKSLRLPLPALPPPLFFQATNRDQSLSCSVCFLSV